MHWKTKWITLGIYASTYSTQNTPLFARRICTLSSSLARLSSGQTSPTSISIIQHITLTIIQHCWTQQCWPFLSDEGPMLEALDYTIRIGSTPTFFIFRFASLLRNTLRLFQCWMMLDGVAKRIQHDIQQYRNHRVPMVLREKKSG